FLREDHSVPTVSLAFAWRGGIDSAPLGDLDAYFLAGPLLHSSGTSGMSMEALADRKKELGMSFEIWLGSTQSGASLSAPTQTFAQSYELAMDILMHPRIGESAVWRQKFRFVGRMEERSERLGAGAAQVFAHVLFGNHPRLGYVPGKWRL